MPSSLLLETVREALMYSADEKTKAGAARFFKEAIKGYGVRMPLVHQISKQCWELLKGKSKGEVFEICEQLWKSGYLEESIVACNWSYRLRKEYTVDDFETFERWVSAYVNNWASCDTLCNHTIGTLLEKFPDLVGRLFAWATSQNRWMRRASAVTLIVPARKGLFLVESMAIADRLLSDRDDLVQKGYGWLLKAAAEAHRETIFEYVMQNKATMPRTALRYAIEKMPDEWRWAAMEKV